MAFQKLAREDEIPAGTTRFIRAGGIPVILAKWGGRVYALHGICPHKNNPLEGARVWDYLLDCPWHHFQYDVRTGENHYPKNVYPQSEERLKAQLRSLAVYAVEIRNGEIWADVNGPETGCGAECGRS